MKPFTMTVLVTIEIQGRQCSGLLPNWLSQIKSAKNPVITRVCFVVEDVLRKPTYCISFDDKTWDPNINTEIKSHWSNFINLLKRINECLKRYESSS